MDDNGGSLTDGIEQPQPLAEDDFLLDVNSGILHLRPTSKQG